MHILWNCPSSNDVWGACGKRWQKCTQGGDSFLELMEDLIDKCKEGELEFFATLARSIWFRRNKVIHGGEFTPPNILIQEAVKAIMISPLLTQRMGSLNPNKGSLHHRFGVPHRKMFIR
jgi:hypothetical protein